MSAVSRGAMVAITEKAVWPPMASSGRVRLSSPDSTEKFGPQAAITWLIWSRLPDASLTPTMFRQSRARRAIVAVSTLIAVRPWMLYVMIGMATASATARTWRDSAARVLVVVRRRGLAGGPARDQAVGAVGDVELDQLPELRLVDATVAERGD